MQHPGKAAIAGVPSPPLPLVDLPTGGPEAKTSLQVEQELKSRRGRPLSRIRDEQLQGANDSRGEVAWGSGSKSSEGADLAEQETDQESMYQRATSSTQRPATETLTRAPHQHVWYSLGGSVWRHCMSSVRSGHLVPYLLPPNRETRCI